MLRQVEVIAYDTPREVLPGITVRVREAGHILGSSSVELWVRKRAVRRKLVFSGDLGQYDTPILHDPYRFESADLVLMESTYGDRRHRGREDTERELGAILAQAARDGGNVIVPAFAIGRSQELLYLLAQALWRMAPGALEDLPRQPHGHRGQPRLLETSRSLRRRGQPAARELSRHAAAAQPGAVGNTGRVARHQRHPRRRASSSRAPAWPMAAACCIT